MGFFSKWWIEFALGAAILSLVFALGYSIGSARKQRAWDQATAKAYRETQEQSNELARVIAIGNRAQQAILDRIAVERDAAIAGLRNRPTRMPIAAAVACAGTTGAELSNSDAEFLARYAADAARADAEARACWEREDKYREAMTGHK